MGVLGGGDELRRRAEVADGGDGEQAERAAADQRDLAGVDLGGGVHGARRWARRSPPPRRSGRRDGRRAASRGRPSASTSRRRSTRRTRLQPRLEVAEADALAVVEAPAAHWSHAGSMPRATQLRTGTTTRGPSSRSPTTSWPGRTGTRRSARTSATTCRRWWRGRSRRCPTGGASPAPSRRRAARAGRRRAAQRPDLGAAAGASRPGHRRRRSGHLPLEHERLHRALAPSIVSTCRRGGSAGRARRLGPDGRAAAVGRRFALSKCSTSQPRLRAMAASLVSGFTATGEADRLEHREVRGGVGVGDASARSKPLASA